MGTILEEGCAADGDRLPKGAAMSQADPRAVAKALHETANTEYMERFEACESGISSSQILIDHIAHALADAERRGLERAAGICEAEALIDDERGYYGKEMAKAIRLKADEIN